MAYTVYMHTTPSGKRYVGITGRKPEKRWESGNGYRGCVFFNAVQKYGWDNIVHEILLTGLTREEAEEKERYYIALFRTMDSRFGYNCTSGGEIQKEITKETRARLSASHKGIGQTAETRAKISAAGKGRKRSVETRAKISAAHKGRPSPRKGKTLPEETRRRMSEAMKGRTVSPEHRAKLGAYRGEKSSFYGKHHTAETCAKISKARSKAVINLDTGEVFPSATAAGKHYGVDRASICACLIGRTKTAAGGYHWAYYTE